MMTVILYLKVMKIKDKHVSMQQSKLSVVLETTAMQHTGSIFGGYTIDWVGREEKSSHPLWSLLYVKNFQKVMEIIQASKIRQSLRWTWPFFNLSYNL